MAGLDGHAAMAALEATGQFSQAQLNQLRKHFLFGDEATFIPMHPRDRDGRALVTAAILATQNRTQCAVYGQSRRQTQQVLASIQAAQTILNQVANQSEKVNHSANAN